MVFALQITKINSKTLETNNNNFVLINNEKFFLNIADTQEKKIRGLMLIDDIPEDKGMVFLFSNPEYKAFWMKNMKIPLDILFIYKNKVVKIYKEVPVCKEDFCPTYESEHKIDSVVELKGGICNKYGIKIGDKIKFSAGIKAKWAKLPE